MKKYILGVDSGGTALSGVCAAAGLGCFALVKPLCQNGTAVAKKA